MSRAVDPFAPPSELPDPPPPRKGVASGFTLQPRYGAEVVPGAQRDPSVATVRARQAIPGFGVERAAIVSERSFAPSTAPDQDWRDAPPPANRVPGFDEADSPPRVGPVASAKPTVSSRSLLVGLEAEEYFEEDHDIPLIGDGPKWPNPPRLDNDGKLAATREPTPVKWGWAETWTSPRPQEWRTATNGTLDDAPSDDEPSERDRLDGYGIAVDAETRWSETTQSPLGRLRGRREFVSEDDVDRPQPGRVQPTPGRTAPKVAPGVPIVATRPPSTPSATPPLDRPATRRGEVPPQARPERRPPTAHAAAPTITPPVAPNPRPRPSATPEARRRVPVAPDQPAPERRPVRPERGERQRRPEADRRQSQSSRSQGPESTTDAEPRSSRRFTVLGFVGLSILFAFLLQQFALQANSIPSTSMSPTLIIDDYVLVNKISTVFGSPGRGDVVVFERPASVPSDDDVFIKRVIGLPGETITFADGLVLIDGEQLDEAYIASPESTFPLVDAIPGCEGTQPDGGCVVPDGSIFVMGDNRRNSSDSRRFGPVKADTVVGRAFMRIWPSSRIGGL